MRAEALRLELLRLRDEDQAVRAELAADGLLSDGYHPRMEEVHRRNAARLAEVIGQRGWPGRAIVGDDGADAAWMIAQHAISEPQFQRRCLALQKAAAAEKEIPLWQPAYLEDRIRMFEGKPQVYGTQYDWDENGEMSPLPIEDSEHVDQRRAALGLIPLAENTKHMREGVLKGKEQRPRDWAIREQELEAWARRVGWREET
jgi:hypothetical protein